jgi:hypothetical protein
MTDNNPVDAINQDAAEDRAPDPRKHYASPECLLEDGNLDPSAREQLLTAWKDEVDQLLAAEAEGMSASDPIRAEAEGRLAAEARRVNAALATARETVAASAS